MAARRLAPLLRRSGFALASSSASSSPSSTTLLRPLIPSRLYASVNTPSAAEEISSSLGASKSSEESTISPAQRAINANRNPNEHRAFIELKKERKLKEYERAIQAKALSEGISVEELKRRVADRLAAKATSDAAQAAVEQAREKEKMSEIEQRDAKIAREIRERAEKEAKRKLESGELGSAPGGGKGPKPLSSILDVDKLSSQDVETITKLWTGYHSLKNKLSSVIPLSLYDAMVARARRYPQFVLPLPRTVTVGGEEMEGGSAEEKKQQGYEMYYLEWGLLPPPPSLRSSTSNRSGPLPTPCTVLFTPLAEYKLRQEFAQPTLVLTFYVDLALSHDVVLMRGDITGAEEAAAAPTGVAAAMSAASKGASQEEVEKLKAPLQSQGKVSQQDAQLLVISLQRFFMPPVLKTDEGVAEKGEDRPDPASLQGAVNAAVSSHRLKPTPEDKLDDEARERLELLQSFHTKPEKFDLARLCKVAFLLG